MDNNTNQNVDTSNETVQTTPTPEVKPVEEVKTEVQAAPVQAEQTPVVEAAPVQQEQAPSVETTKVQEQAPAPVQKAKPEEKSVETPKEEVKKEKPLKMKKKKGIAGTIFLLLILLALIVLLTMIILNLDKVYNLPKGVTDLNDIHIEEKVDVLYDSKMAINNLDPYVKDSITHYLTKHSDKTYKEYVNELPNSTKLYLAGLNGKSSVTLNTLKTNIKEVFGFDVTIEGENVLADDKKTVLYTYDEKTGVFNKNTEVTDKVYTPFTLTGEFLPMEYDDPTGSLENSEVIVYGMVVIQTKKGNKFLNNRFTFIEGLSFEEIKEKLPTLYGDQKENFDVVKYKITKNGNKYIVNDIKLN